MPAVSNPKRTPVFRLLTIASSGIGSFVLGIWGLKHGLGEGFAGISADMMVAIMAALCALAASVAAMSFFAGIDESADFVFNETHFDKLTGLLARPAMVGKIAEAACATSRTGEPVFLIDIDIDRFKQINDAIGYTQGDELIRAFTKRLHSCVPARAPIGRIGAGEFAVLLPDHLIQGTLESMVERLIDEMMEPYELSSHQQSVSLSVGIVAMPKDGVDPVLILRRSNLALQNARASGVGNWSVFDSEMGRVADHRQWVESELHSAFERGDFDLHYQPQLDLPTGRIVGYEALIRWQHPERGMIPPMEFIQIAEETGMINPIGEWVLRKACSDARHLPDDCFVAVNISPVQFMTKDFVGLVRDTMRTTGIKPSRLELEVTETAMMQDRDRAAAILKELAEMGISVAVDDFGTGYSNLSYLIDFSFGKLKIDRSFISRIDTDASSGAVVSTIVGLSRALGVSIIAEGVETESQATLLRAAGCEVVQGYLFGRPAPLEISVGDGHVADGMRRVANLH
ncbi:MULTISPECIES: bifunctional diguanylate cyclase/phosphodiesterase [unclassified Mesorhizobium]|uniref:putative bifunctional diguanylate cyclase/phosphodiesterase n=1 Tax=unclassified Mesorhizobium TaxID=325217 RepID=UPI000FCC23AB|nr:MULTISPECIES: bifunctional diguanylate cyclase/phosphodiesterase [unclassified Mesorhizobium]RUW54606.1 bifunctional diguanylate cyclase/phosphodiesterase [Mesorhizobium sp. M8A.F.Ca.ET.021.01.1.1]TGQ88025.1 bifunctional diguanylate cyclase/phosphodiesterase [Mesorhizobium sp. M8A.F.Ca.ET.208.01.1.1]TGT49760.1 bifunctional diguanylate cyclase/phosphodiesterase [Mesorhizobium sp. M8A.F.Ca.ET.167.01.1.1]TGT86332.1 bifunctional diguanylate cyclase/phosphodiesterase [Mesorhizobium sp. M8A.F.Ca.E